MIYRYAQNPDRLTLAQIEQHLGYRLLYEDEVVHGITSKNHLIEAWNGYREVWSAGYNGNSSTLTYRTKVTCAELRQMRGLPPEYELAPVRLKRLRMLEF